MSHVPGHGPTVGVAGAEFVAPAPGGGGFGEGGPGVGAVGVDEILPFTGSALTFPIALLGLVLTFLGWLLTRLGAEEDGGT
jgi:hypothetical protein